jgi:hypothetical protein
MPIITCTNPKKMPIITCTDRAPYMRYGRVAAAVHLYTRHLPLVICSKVHRPAQIQWGTGANVLLTTQQTNGEFLLFRKAQCTGAKTIHQRANCGDA